MLMTMLNCLWIFIKIPLFIIIAIIVLFTFLCLIWFLILFFQGKRPKRGLHFKVKTNSIFKRLFFDFPRRFMLDVFERDPEFFRHQGLIIYEGRQGSGKTSTMIHDTMQIQKEYPLCKCITNLKYTHQDDSLTDWRQLIDYKNGIRGVVVVMDELQNWFGSNQSKDFPPEMLSVITQNRKNRRVIFGTAQSFYLLAKAIRSQCIEVRECTTIFGCLTFVRRKIPILDSDGNVCEWKRRGMYFYVHSDELREAYNTYEVIENLSKSGFKPRLPDTEINNTNVIISDMKRRGILNRK